MTDLARGGFEARHVFYWHSFHASGSRYQIPRKPIPETVEPAAEADDEDRIFSLGIADDLQTMLGRSGEVYFDEIACVLEPFTARSRKTPKWDLAREAFTNAVAAGAALRERNEKASNPATGEDLAETEWLDLCRRAGSGPAASDVVTGVFEADHYV